MEMKNIISVLEELDSLYLVRSRDSQGGLIEVFKGNSYEEVKGIFEENDLEVVNIIKLTDLSHGEEIVLLP